MPFGQHDKKGQAWTPKPYGLTSLFPSTSPPDFAIYPALVGRIAQLAEQLTLNQRVQGSSPCAPTKFFRPL